MKIMLLILVSFSFSFTLNAMSKKSGWWKSYKAPSVKVSDRRCDSPCLVEFSLKNRDKRLKNKDFSYN